MGLAECTLGEGSGEHALFRAYVRRVTKSCAGIPGAPAKTPQPI